MVMDWQHCLTDRSWYVQNKYSSQLLKMLHDFVFCNQEKYFVRKRSFLEKLFVQRIKMLHVQQEHCAEYGALEKCSKIFIDY